MGKSVNEESKFSRPVVSEWLSGVGMLVAAGRFRDCGEGGRGWVGLCPEGHEVYHAFTCEQRICPSCAGRRSRLMQDKLTQPILDMIRSAPSSHRLAHLTLGTNINIVDYMQLSSPRALNRNALNSLRELTKAMRGAAVDMLRYYARLGLKYDKVATGEFRENGNSIYKRVRRPFSSKIEGFAIGCEFGFNAGTLHLHILMLADFIDVFEMSKKWEYYNHGHGSYVHIEQVGDSDKAVEKEVAYVSKYVTKPLGKKDRDDPVTLTPNVLRMSAWVADNGVESVMAAMSYVFDGMRRFQTYGCFYDLELPPGEPEVCSVCGAGLYWISELDYFSGENAYAESVKTLSTNKLNEACDLSPPECPVKVRLPGF